GRGAGLGPPHVVAQDSARYLKGVGPRLRHGCPLLTVHQVDEPGPPNSSPRHVGRGRGGQTPTATTGRRWPAPPAARRRPGGSPAGARRTPVADPDVPGTSSNRQSSRGYRDSNLSPGASL